MEGLRRLKDIEEQKKENEKLRRRIEIKDEYLKLIADIGYDYEECNSVDGLKSVIEELIELGRRGLEEDIESCVYIGDKGERQNILKEKINGD